MFHCLCLKRASSHQVHTNSSRGFGVGFFAGARRRNTTYALIRVNFRTAGVLSGWCVCWTGHTSRLCWIFNRVDENSGLSGTVLKLPFVAYHHDPFLCLMALLFNKVISSLSISTESGTPSLTLVMSYFCSVVFSVHLCPPQAFIFGWLFPAKR